MAVATRASEVAGLAMGVSSVTRGLSSFVTMRIGSTRSVSLVSTAAISKPPLKASRTRCTPRLTSDPLLFRLPDIGHLQRRSGRQELQPAGNPAAARGPSIWAASRWPADKRAAGPARPARHESKPLCGVVEGDSACDRAIRPLSSLSSKLVRYADGWRGRS